MKRKVMTWLLLVVMAVSLFPSVALGASNRLEVVSAKVINDTQVELKFSEALHTNVLSWIGGNTVAVGIVYTKDEIDSSAGWPGFDAVTKGTQFKGTVAFGQTSDTLIWTINSSHNVKVSDLAGAKDNGYTAKFFFFDNGCGWHGANAIGAVQNADGSKPLYTPYGRSASYEYMFIDIAPYENPNLELLSATAISDTQVELKFSEALNAKQLNWISGNNVDLGIVWIKDEIDSSAGWPGFDAVTKGTRFKGTVAFGQTNDTLIWTINSSHNMKVSALAGAKDNGYTRKFYFFDNGTPWHGANAIGAVQNADGSKPLYTPYGRSASYEYMFIDITPYENPNLELLSVKQIGARQVELKFSEDLKTRDVNGTPWIVDQINKGSAVKVGIAWVKDDYAIEVLGFDSITTGLVDGTVAMGATNDTLIWTAPETAKSVTALLGESLEGYSLRFYLRDTSCYWISAFHTISAVQNADGTKALYTPVSRGDGGYEYLFEPITPYESPYVELLSVNQSGENKLELKFSEALKTTDVSGTPWIVDTINKGEAVKVGMAWVKDDYAQTLPGFDTIATDVIEGTVAMGATNDTLVWTLSDTTKDLSAMMNEKKEGYSLKFFLRDTSCYWISAFNTISAVQNADGTKALYTPVSRGDGGYEYLFADIAFFGELTLAKASIISGNEIILKFSAPVEFKYKPFIGLRIMDENMNMVFDNGSPMQIYEGSWEYTDDIHDTIKWTSKDWILEDYVNLSGKFEKYNQPGYKTYFCIEEMQDAAGVEIDTKGNGYIDNIVRGDGKMLVASKKATGENYDGVYVEIVEEYREPDFYLMSVTLINSKQLALEFNKPVQFDEKLPYIGVRYVDETLKLQYEGKTPLQYQGTWAYGNEEKTVVIITESFGGNYESVVKKTGSFSKYADFDVMFCIEEIPADKDKGDVEDGTIHNVFTAGGKRLHANKVAGGSGWDGLYMPITVNFDYTVPGTPIKSAIKNDGSSVKKPEVQNDDTKDKENEPIEVRAGSASEKLLMAVREYAVSNMPWIVFAVCAAAFMGVMTVLVIVLAKRKTK